MAGEEGKPAVLTSLGERVREEKGERLLILHGDLIASGSLWKGTARCQGQTQPPVVPLKGMAGPEGNERLRWEWRGLC